MPRLITTSRLLLQRVFNRRHRLDLFPRRRQAAHWEISALDSAAPNRRCRCTRPHQTLSTRGKTCTIHRLHFRPTPLLLCFPRGQAMPTPHTRDHRLDRDRRRPLLQPPHCRTQPSPEAATVAELLTLPGQRVSLPIPATNIPCRRSARIRGSAILARAKQHRCRNRRRPFRIASGGSVAGQRPEACQRTPLRFILISS